MEAINKVLSEVEDFVSSRSYKSILSPRLLFRGEHNCYPTVKSGLRREFDKIVDYPRVKDRLDKTYIGNYLRFSEEFIYYQAKYFINSSDSVLKVDADNLLPLGVDIWDAEKVLSEIQQRIGGTNLIDFSSDINIALFFATKDWADLGELSDGRLIVYAYSSVETNYDIFQSPDAGFSAEQSSWFVKPKDQGCLDITNTDCFKIINIPYADKVEIHNYYLNRYHNIRDSTVFRGIEGFLRSSISGSHIAPSIVSKRAFVDIEAGDYLVIDSKGSLLPYRGHQYNTAGMTVVGRALKDSNRNEIAESITFRSLSFYL